MNEVLPIGLSSWIIQDGNYPDFEVGQERPFALQFYAHEPLKAMRAQNIIQPQHVYRGDCRFSIIGKSIHAGLDWWAMDFGIPAYTSHAPPMPHKVGDLFEGDIYLGVDRYDYFELFSRSADAPALIFDWRVERIEMQTASFIEQEDRMMIRDPAKIGWRDLPETNAWKDDGGHAEYILHCVRLSDTPRRTLNK